MTSQERLLFVGGSAHGEVREVDHGADLWLVLNHGHAERYQRATVYEHGPDLPDFFQAMLRSTEPPVIADALRIARAAGWPGPTYIDRAIDAMRERRGPWAEQPARP